MTTILEDVAFLEGLNARLTKETELGADRFFPRRKSFRFTDEKLTGEEFERVLGLINRVSGDFAVEPGNDGFHPFLTMYAVNNLIPGMKFEAKPKLYIRETQFPDGVKWGRVSEVYMGERNLEVLALCGLEQPKPDQGTYEY